jgi:histidinol-phosphatase (PHP family)
MIYRTDYHIHTMYSDGKAEPEDYIVPAISAGIKELGFSEHINLFVDNQMWCMDPGRISDYISHLSRLREAVSNIQIRIGLEIDYFPGKEEEIYKYIKGLELDYVLGSVHYLGDMTVDNGADFYENKNIDELYDSYFGYVNEAVASGLFDIIAHCDLIRIYGYKPATTPEHLYRVLAHNMKIHDVAFEVNTNGRNRPLGDFYPDRRFLKFFSEENVPVCVNSDAHMPARVGQYFDEAYLLLKESGYKEMAVFNNHERSLVPANF